MLQICEHPCTVLLQVSVPVVSDTQCRTVFGNEIKQAMLCAGGEKGKDGCQVLHCLPLSCMYIVRRQGDSGGPLTVVDPTTGRHTVVGTNSWGDGCGKVVWTVVCCTAMV